MEAPVVSTGSRLVNAPHCPLDRAGWGNKLSSRLGKHGRSEAQPLTALRSTKRAVVCRAGDAATISEVQRCYDDRLGTSSSLMTLTMRPTGLGHGVYQDGVDASASTPSW